MSPMFCARLCFTIVLFAFLTDLCVAAEAGRAERSRPLAVAVGIYVDNLVSVDEQRETWQLSGELSERWRDAKLAYHQISSTDSHRDLSGTTWQPALRFSNEAIPATLQDIDLYLTPPGTVVNLKHFNVILSTQLDLRRFPFDKQELPIVIQPRGHDADRIVLSADLRHSGLARTRYAELSQWRNETVTAHAETRRPDDYDMSTLVFLVTLHRGSNSYVWKFILPLFLIVLLSWVSFWLSHEEFKTKDQLATLVSTLLIIVAFNITATASLPRTNYVTYIDAFLLTCFMFVVFAIGAVVASHSLEMRERVQAALHMRRLAGMLLPVTFITTQVGLFAWFFRG